jgi:hypothetical protein
MEFCVSRPQKVFPFLFYTYLKSFNLPNAYMYTYVCMYVCVCIYILYTYNFEIKQYHKKLKVWVTTDIQAIHLTGGPHLLSQHSGG